MTSTFMQKCISVLIPSNIRQLTKPQYRVINAHCPSFLFLLGNSIKIWFFSLVHFITFNFHMEEYIFCRPQEFYLIPSLCPIYHDLAIWYHFPNLTGCQTWLHREWRLETDAELHPHVLHWQMGGVSSLPKTQRFWWWPPVAWEKKYVHKMLIHLQATAKDQWIILQLYLRSFLKSLINVDILWEAFIR